MYLVKLENKKVFTVDNLNYLTLIKSIKSIKLNQKSYNFIASF